MIYGGAWFSQGFLGGSIGKDPTMWGKTRFDPWVAERSPGDGNGNLLQLFLRVGKSIKDPESLGPQNSDKT